MLRRSLCQADIQIVIELVDPVLVKSGHASMDGTDMVPVSTLRKGKRIYYLPGTSLKGTLRSHFERIARTLKPKSVCLPYYDPKGSASPPVISECESYGCGYRSRGEDVKDNNSATAYADSCAACRLFGSLKFTGRFSVGDAYPLPSHPPKLETRNSVAIDRFTGGTVRGALFDLQALVDGKFKADIRLTNFEIWQLAGVKLLLDDMTDELITVGSGRSRGFGRVRAAVESFRIIYFGREESLVGIGQIATATEQEDYALHDWMPDGRVQLPNPTLRGLRQCYDLSSDWSERLQSFVPAFLKFLQWRGPHGEVLKAAHRQVAES